jgi:hypothetical protein
MCADLGIYEYWTEKSCFNLFARRSKRTKLQLAKRVAKIGRQTIKFQNSFFPEAGAFLALAARCERAILPRGLWAAVLASIAVRRFPTHALSGHLSTARRSARFVVEFAAHAADGKLVRLFRLSKACGR